ncbi:MAG: STM4015 family protein, partial [Verrucomicrobiales bacterium]|nr:STM4015 family protein [Verrucomicrobiales bacterium]
GYPVKLFDSEASEKGVTDYANTVYRLALDWDSELDFPTLFSHFLTRPSSAQTPAMIIGQFHGDDPGRGSEEVVQLLVSAQPKLPQLRGIFIGDVVSEENEISWIIQTDVSPLLVAYPKLEHLRLRGTGELSLGSRLAHQKLKSLTIETGGLPPRLLQEVLASQLPVLESLELWLGTPNYGGDVTVPELQPLLSGKLFPALKHLGLRDSEIIDDIAAALPSAQILSRLESLDLSLGTLSDAGGKELLDNPGLKRLKRLDLHHHYLSEEMMAALKRVLPAANVDDPQGNDTSLDDRYVAVSE